MSRSNPYVFTEQGIYMLITVLKGDLATRQSMTLIRLFKQMKDYIVAENQQLRGITKNAIVHIFSEEWGDEKITPAIKADFEKTRETRLQRLCKSNALNFTTPLVEALLKFSNY